jgi:DNA-binding GntR family transcriptional regulator
VSVAERPGRRGGAAVAHALAELRARIVSGQLAPGAELSQTGLADELGVSTTPLREALRRLEAEGLIETRPNRRPRVPPFDADDVDALYCSRLALEPLAASLAVPLLGDAGIAALRDDLAAMRHTASGADVSAWDAAHASFHRRLVDTGNPALTAQIAALMARADRYRRLSVHGDDPAGRLVGDGEHAEIVEAAAARDGDCAARLLARQLARSALTLVAHLAPEADPVSVRAALRAVNRWAGAPYRAV